MHVQFGWLIFKDDKFLAAVIHKEEAEIYNNFDEGWIECGEELTAQRYKECTQTHDAGS